LQLPRGEEAVVDLRKVEGYLLSPEPPTGRRKARVFMSAFGLTAGGALFLAASLREAAATGEASETGRGAYGRRFRIDFEMTHAGRAAVLRSAWLLPSTGGPPIFLTAFAL
jgi:hypothetical protein